MLSTIGYTLNSWKMHNEALLVFEKRLEYFPDKLSVYNQIGITQLSLGRKEEARNSFLKMVELDSFMDWSHKPQ